MKDKTFSRSVKLVPEVINKFFISSFIALLATGLRMVGPNLISNGIDDGVLKSDYNYTSTIGVLFYNFGLLYFVTSQAAINRYGWRNVCT